MKIVSIADARTNLSKYVEEVSGEHEVVHITRHGSGAAVLISEEQWELFEENRFWHQPENAALVEEGVAAFERGDVIPLETVEAELSNARLE